MAGPAQPTAVSPVILSKAGEPASSSASARPSPSGTGDGKSTLQSASNTETPKATLFARGISGTWAGVKWPFIVLYRILSVPVIWIKNKVSPPKETVAVSTIELVGSDGKVKKYSVDHALENGIITPKEALEKHKVKPEYLTVKGWDTVKVAYTNWYWAARTFEGTLRDAIKGKYISAEEAVKQGLITKELAIKGEWLKAEPTQKPAESKSEKAK
jgi:hypothetical protein